MPLYLVYCVDRPGSDALRAKLSDDGETAGGSAFIVNVPDRAEGA